MRRLSSAFTLLELLVAMTVLILLAVVLVGITTQTAATWKYSTARAEQFQEARRAYETVTRRLSQATLNTYYDYAYPLDAKGNPDTTQQPTSYIRQSELRFRSGQMVNLMRGAGRSAYRPTHGVFFQATFGVSDTSSYRITDNLLNAWGYFVELGDDSDQVPKFLQGVVPSTMRYRLMEFRQSSETMSLYQLSPNVADDTWFSQLVNAPATTRPVRVMTNNIVALIILPKLTPEDQAARNTRVTAKYQLLSPVYDYDSKKTSNYTPAPPASDTSLALEEINPKNQLPPLVQVGMVAIDEISARNLARVNHGLPDLGLKTSDLFLQANSLDTGAVTHQQQDGDLSKFEQRLIAAKVSYRFYMSNVAIRGAKWSRSQTN